MNKHTEHSSYREKLIEHLFIGELLKINWMTDKCDLEVGKPEVDNSGYDVILESNNAIRHVQLKASYVGGATSQQKVHLKLADKPSGCVIWIYFDKDSLDLGPFLYYGGKPGKQLPSIETKKVARHTKSDQEGYKAKRPNIRVLNKGDFKRHETIRDIYHALFG